MFDIAVDDVLEVKFWYTCGNDRALNVRHYVITDKDPGALPVTSVDLANQIQTGYSADLTAAMSIDASFDAVTVQRLSPVPKSVLSFSTGISAPGTLLLAVLPRQVAGLISLQTQFSGARNRGRFYMPYPDEFVNTTNGVPTAGYFTILTAIKNRLIAPGTIVTAGGNWNFKPVIVHRGGGPSTFITAGIVRSTWASQRRRNNAKF